MISKIVTELKYMFKSISARFITFSGFLLTLDHLNFEESEPKGCLGWMLKYLLGKRPMPLFSSAQSEKLAQRLV